MTDYLAALKERVRQKHPPEQPSKPPKAPFEGFEGAQGRGFYEIDPTGFAERSALIEYGAGAPRDWAEGFARLDLAKPPSGFYAARWQLVINDGGKFLDRWAAEAGRLGWQASDVFGVHPVAPSCRYDRMGLVLLINGGEVISIEASNAVIKTHPESLTPRGVVVWQWQCPTRHTVATPQVRQVGATYP
jgi:hypothetical protein